MNKKHQQLINQKAPEVLRNRQHDSHTVLRGTHSNVLLRGLSATEVVLGEELSQLRLDAAQRLVLAVKQHHQVRHGEGLTHQHQQLPKEPCNNTHNQREATCVSPSLLVTYLKAPPG